MFQKSLIFASALTMALSMATLSAPAAAAVDAGINVFVNGQTSPLIFSHSFPIH